MAFFPESEMKAVLTGFSGNLSSSHEFTVFSFLLLLSMSFFGPLASSSGGSIPPLIVGDP